MVTVKFGIMFDAYLVDLKAEKTFCYRVKDRQTDGHLHFLSCFRSRKDYKEPAGCPIKSNRLNTHNFREHPVKIQLYM